MKIAFNGLRTVWSAAVAFVLSAGTLACAVAAENIPPTVRIVWPNTNTIWDWAFGYGTAVKIKAEAFDVDGSISEVQFYMLTNLIGVVTNPPYTVIWNATKPVGELPQIKAVAKDDSGAVVESEWLTLIVYTGGLPRPVVEIVSPESGSMFAEPATFSFSAEVLAAEGGIGAIDFYIGSNVVGRVDYRNEYLTATSPPLATVMVTNLAQGEYDLYLRNRSISGDPCEVCYVLSNHIRVVRLGIQTVPQNPGEPFKFDVITSYTNRPNVVERSRDLREWSAVETNHPSANRFTFVDQVEAATCQAFYRIIVPPD